MVEPVERRGGELDLVILVDGEGLGEREIVLQVGLPGNEGQVVAAVRSECRRREARSVELILHQTCFRVARQHWAIGNYSSIGSEERTAANTQGARAHGLRIARRRNRCGIVLDVDARQCVGALLPDRDAGDHPAVDGAPNEPVAVEEVRFLINVRRVEDKWPVEVVVGIVRRDVERIPVLNCSQRLRPGEACVDRDGARPLLDRGLQSVVGLVIIVLEHVHGVRSVNSAVCVGSRRATYASAEGPEVGV